MKYILIAAVLVTTMLSPVALAGSPQVTVLADTDKTVTGQPIVSPDHPVVKTTIITFQPGEKTAVHKHPFPHYGYMLEGTLTITNSETGKSFEMKAGEFLVEMQNTAHYGENRGNIPVKILIIDSVPEGVASNSIAVQP